MVDWIERHMDLVVADHFTRELDVAEGWIDSKPWGERQNHLGRRDVIFVALVIRHGN